MRERERERERERRAFYHFAWKGKIGRWSLQISQDLNRNGGERKRVERERER